MRKVHHLYIYCQFNIGNASVPPVIDSVLTHAAVALVSHLELLYRVYDLIPCICSRCCRFNADSAGLLVASDVAARGLDFMNVDHVIHFQVPMNTEVR